MSADTAGLPAAPRPRTAALRRLTVTELTLFLRERVSIIWGIGFPLVLLIILGNIPGFRKPVSPAAPRVPFLDAYVPILLAFVLAMIALNVLPPVLAGYREKGVLRRLSATPVGAVRVLAAQLIVDAGMTAVTMIALLWWPGSRSAWRSRASRPGSRWPSCSAPSRCSASGCCSRRCSRRAGAPTRRGRSCSSR